MVSNGSEFTPLIMMTALLQHILLLLTAVTVLLTVSEACISQKVCTGDSVLLFQINDYNSCVSDLKIDVLIRNDKEDNSNIATWLHQNCTPNATLETNYEGRLFLHKNGSITMHNVSNLDNKRYFAVSNNPDQLPDKHDVQLVIMVPPSKDCKPNIIEHGEELTATLKAEKCGSTKATPYWESCINIPDTNSSKLNISPRNMNRVYKACIKGDALDCVKNKSELENYCSIFHAKESTLNRKDIEKLPNRHHGHCLKTHCSSLTWKDIEEQLNDIQHKGLKTYCSSVLFEHIYKNLSEYQRKGLDSFFSSVIWKEFEKRLIDYQRQDLESFCKTSQEKASRIFDVQIAITILVAIMICLVIPILIMMIKMYCLNNTDETGNRKRRRRRKK